MFASHSIQDSCQGSTIIRKPGLHMKGSSFDFLKWGGGGEFGRGKNFF